MAKRQQRSLFSTTKLYNHTQVQIANALGKSSQQKQTTQGYLILAVKLDSVLMFLRLWKKIELPVMGDKTNFCRSSHT